MAAGMTEATTGFTASHDITLYVLEESGHNHNVSPNRERLWARMVGWARSLGPL